MKASIDFKMLPIFFCRSTMKNTSTEPDTRVRITSRTAQTIVEGGT